MASPYTRSITICTGWGKEGAASGQVVWFSLGCHLNVVVHVLFAHHLGGEQLDEAQLDKAQLDKAQLDKAQLDEGQLDEAQGGEHGFCGRLDKLLVIAAPAHAQRARLECGAVL